MITLPRKLPMKPAALGFRAHSGWAVLIAVSGDRHLPDVIARRRLDLVDSNAPGARQPYHAAAEMDFARAEKFIARSIERTSEIAREALLPAIDGLRGKDYQPVTCGILLASGRPLPDLKSTLASHPLIHTAEGELFRNALMRASEASGLQVTRFKEREVFDRAAAALHLSSTEITRRLGELGRAMGPPWRLDEKLATVAAWIALASLKATG
ncbi:MAG TPA: hypothetical protein VJN43_23815 [Bryobacteraceae bacterium]|nr:hypothetical protein [Bryobacteraceae bacterium]